MSSSRPSILRTARSRERSPLPLALCLALAAATPCAAAAALALQDEVRPAPPPRLSQALQRRLDQTIIAQYLDCWTFDGPPSNGYVPAIAVSLARDGSVEKEPVLLDLPVGAEQARLAASAIAAVRRCDPIAIPRALASYAWAWRRRVIRFDPNRYERPDETSEALPAEGPAALRAGLRRFRELLDGRLKLR